MVEFALILLPLLTIVTGIIWFGIGLNYWLDMQRIANQGARWAAVDNWPPECPRGSTSCTNNPPCDAANRDGATLQNTLRCQALTNGLRSSVTVQICYPGKNPTTARVGDPVRIKLSMPFTFFFVDRVGITLSANATMRLEVRPSDTTPSLITGAANTCT